MCSPRGLHAAGKGEAGMRYPGKRRRRRRNTTINTNTMKR